MPKAGYHQTVCAEIVRLLFDESKRQRLSNYAVAQRSGVSESMISLVERGLRNPSMELVLKLADGIGADLPKIVAKAQKTTPAK